MVNVGVAYVDRARLVYQQGPSSPTGTVHEILLIKEFSRKTYPRAS